MAKHVMLLTGTPVLNHPGEVFPHLRALAPARIAEQTYLGFTARYCTTKILTTLTKSGIAKQREVINGANQAEMPDLARRMRGFWLRRKTEDVLDQLPPLNYGNSPHRAGAV